MRSRQSLLALAWALVIFLTSCTYVPSRTFVHVAVSHSGIAGLATESQFAKFWDSWWWVFVKGYHVLEFALLTALVYRAFRVKSPALRAIMWAAPLALAYAASDEFHQTFVKDRGGKWTDVAIDAIGISVVTLWVVVRRAPAQT